MKQLVNGSKSLKVSIFTIFMKFLDDKLPVEPEDHQLFFQLSWDLLYIFAHVERAPTILKDEIYKSEE